VRANQAAQPKTKTTAFLPKVEALKSNRTALMAAGGAALLAVILAVWYFGFHKSSEKGAPPVTAQAPTIPQPVPPAVTQPAPAAVAAVEENTSTLGGVILKTTPKGATVTLGGLEAGKSPVTFKGIRAGKYPLRISLEGYTPVEQEVEVKAGQFVDLGTIVLVRMTEAKEPPKVVTEQREEPRPQLQPTPPLPANTDTGAAKTVVPLNDFGGG
jgi:hypothetical protein